MLFIMALLQNKQSATWANSVTVDPISFALTINNLTMWYQEGLIIIYWIHSELSVCKLHVSIKVGKLRFKLMVV